jgi:hypothetical protein
MSPLLARKVPHFMAYFPSREGSGPFTLRTQIEATAPFSIAETWLSEGQGGNVFLFIFWLR